MATSSLILSACSKTPEQASEELKTTIPELQNSIKEFKEAQDKLNGSGDLGFVPFLAEISSDEWEEATEGFSKEGVFNTPDDKKNAIEVTKKLQEMASQMDKTYTLLVIKFKEASTIDPVGSKAQDRAKEEVKKIFKTELNLKKLPSPDSKLLEEQPSEKIAQNNHSGGHFNSWLWYHYMLSSNRRGASYSGLGTQNKSATPSKNPVTGKNYTHRFQTRVNQIKSKIKKGNTRVGRARSSARSGGRFGGK